MNDATQVSKNDLKGAFYNWKVPDLCVQAEFPCNATFLNVKDIIGNLVFTLIAIYEPSNCIYDLIKLYFIVLIIRLYK
jgi:hypothetical protein